MGSFGIGSVSWTCAARTAVGCRPCVCMCHRFPQSCSLARRGQTRTEPLAQVRTRSAVLPSQSCPVGAVPRVPTAINVGPAPSSATRSSAISASSTVAHTVGREPRSRRERVGLPRQIVLRALQGGGLELRYFAIVLCARVHSPVAMRTRRGAA